MYAALAENFGNLRDKLSIFCALAPVVNLKNTPNGMLENASKFWRQLEPAASKFNLYEIRSPKQDKLMNAFC